MPHDHVILLHGIARTKRCMAKLAAHLQANGFQTHNLDYPSTKHTLADLTTWLHERVAPIMATPDTRIHFVGYSMGGLLIRSYVQQYRPLNLGRVVMLGTPNGGSEIADTLQNLWLFRKFYGPAGQQLITDQTNFAHLFSPAINYELGIIAGNRPLDPICSWWIGRRKTDKANDGKVSVESTKLNGMRDHLAIRIDHTFLPTNSQAIQQTLYFLQHGTFNRAV